MGVDTSNNSMKDFHDHERTYGGFIILLKVSVAIAVATLLLLALIVL